MSLDDYMPDEVRMELLELRRECDGLIKLRDKLRKRKADVSPAAWRELRRYSKTKLTDTIERIAEIKRQMKQIIHKFGEPAKETSAQAQSTDAGDPLHLQMPRPRSALDGHLVRLDDEDSEIES